MRTLFDFSPLHRSSIGFDRVFDLLESAARTQQTDNYPPFDSIKLGDDSYRITMAVAGFTQDELTISAQGNLLLVSGEHKVEPEGEFLHRGIASRAFNRRFELAEHIYVTGARLANGLLSIDLKREVPEAMKPRRISINGDEGIASTVKQIHTEAA
ncbi:molecular chaperone IbpA [Luteibacter sp. UNCMF331Sha3.1]|nr:Hsp20 family protein [Luteibacter sp. UNCMF331Sha3.1]SEM24796.1 molecular chaperone IbpA [Luteibacter sp. UNCMF331Sha3.1]